MNVLVIDVGGSHVKMLATGQSEPTQFDSGPDFTPTQLVEGVRQQTAKWKYDAVSIGYPGAVGARGPSDEPGNLGIGWVGYDFQAALGRQVRIINDAVMQALGAYQGGRMLFLGLGTGLGSALVVDGVVLNLELGCMPHQLGGTMADRLGKEALSRDGEAAWQRALRQAVEVLLPSFCADYIMLGGGNAAHVDPLPPDARRGGNEDAFTGGFRLWEEREGKIQAPQFQWRLVYS